MTIPKKQLQIKEKAIFRVFFFWVCYTVVFFLFLSTLKYTFPFLLGFLLALALQPAMRLFTLRLHLKSGLASFLCTTVVFFLFFGMIVLLGFALVSELSTLVIRLSQTGLPGLQQLVAKLFEDLSDIFSRIDAHFLKENQEQILSLFNSSIRLLTATLSRLLSFLTSLPAIFTMVVVLIFSTYFFTKDMPYFKKAVISRFSQNTLQKLNEASSHGASMLGKYIRSYLLIYFITFLESFFIFWGVHVQYPLVLSLVCAVADIIPILGPGLVYLPLSLFLLISGRWFSAIALLIAWGIITLVRQIIEPKIVSSSIEIHPLCMLLALYVSLVCGSFSVFLYLTTFFVFYQIMKKIGVLSPIFPPRPKKSVKRKK